MDPDREFRKFRKTAARLDRLKSLSCEGDAPPPLRCFRCAAPVDELARMQTGAAWLCSCGAVNPWTRP